MKRWTGTFFDEGVVLPDQRGECPTNGSAREVLRAEGSWQMEGVS
jgi:hypothetical protein